MSSRYQIYIQISAIGYIHKNIPERVLYGIFGGIINVLCFDLLPIENEKGENLEQLLKDQIDAYPNQVIIMYTIYHNSIIKKVLSTNGVNHELCYLFPTRITRRNK